MNDWEMLTLGILILIWNFLWAHRVLWAVILGLYCLLKIAGTAVNICAALWDIKRLLESKLPESPQEQAQRREREIRHHDVEFVADVWGARQKEEEK